MQWFSGYSLGNHHRSLSPEYFHWLQKKPHTHYQSVSISIPKPPLICFLPLWICLFWTSHINGIVQHMVFWNWLFISFSIMFSRFAHLISCISTSFLFVATEYSIVRIDHFCLSICWWTFGLFLPFHTDELRLLCTLTYKFLCGHLF